MPQLSLWIILTLLQFSAGLFGLLTRKSIVGILISVELMLNAGAMNLVMMNRYLRPAQVDGQIMAIFVMAVAAAEVLVGIAILIMLFRRRKSVDVTELAKMRF